MIASYNIHQDSDDLTNAGSSHNVDPEETESETEPVEDNKTDNLQPAGYSLPNPIQNHPPRHSYITRRAYIYNRSGRNDLGGLSYAGNADLVQHRVITYTKIPVAPGPGLIRHRRHSPTHHRRSPIVRRVSSTSPGGRTYIPKMDATSFGDLQGKTPRNALNEPPSGRTPPRKSLVMCISGLTYKSGVPHLKRTPGLKELGEHKRHYLSYS